MTSSGPSPLPDLTQALRAALAGEVRIDHVTRLLYSTDASIYQVEPLGVVFPRTQDDLAATMEIAAVYDTPVIARGAGSSLAGQALGPALIVDCSRYLRRILDIGEMRAGDEVIGGTAVVEPGVVLAALNREAARLGLQFGPDPASAERATVGGSLANNATGAHSIVYGMAADHLLAAEVVLSDGSLANLGDVPLGEASRRAGLSHAATLPLTSLEMAFYRAALDIRHRYSDAIRESWPVTWRRASGYNLNYLLPWSPSKPPHWPGYDDGLGSSVPYPPVVPGTLNLASLLAGSEGTLGIIRRATLRLLPVPKHTILGLLAFPSIVAACDAVPGILEQGPSAVELIPQELIRLARSSPAYASQVAFVDQLAEGGDPPALLVVEFAGDHPGRMREQALALGSGVLLAETPAEQRRVWGVRKVGLGILQSRPGDVQPISFIEDLAVPVEHLGEFVREMDRIMAAHGTRGSVYAHASAGCLHIRPLLSLKTIQGVTALRAIATQAVTLTLRLGGSVSGEHGDGLARSEWLERMFGAEIMAAFAQLKQAVDPRGLLNPGKIVCGSDGIGEKVPPMDTRLRYGPHYEAPGAWQPTLDFSSPGGPDGGSQDGLVAAVEQCNGAGVCRKEDGVMCPSFQATQDEMHSTRGRANLLRAMISGRFPTERLAEKAVYEALDLCLACKGCKAECPSGVDMARLKYEFTQHYYSPAAKGRHRRNLRDYLFGYIGPLARLGQPFAPLLNRVLSDPRSAGWGERFLGLTPRRKLPAFSRRSLHSQAAGLPAVDGPVSVLFLSDAFTTYFYPETGMAALRLLAECGLRAAILPVIGAGRTLISKGLLGPARGHASSLLEAISRLDPEERLPVVGVEPSEIYTLRDEYFDLLPGVSRLPGLARRAFMIDEFLARPGPDGQPRLSRLDHQAHAGQRVLLHGHCYQKAQPPAEDGYPVGVPATVAMLEAAGYTVEVVDSGCCGMAGAFGYEAEHYDLSMQVGELALLPAVRQAGEGVIVAACGVSCQAQIEDGASRQAVHPVTLVQAK